MEFPYMKRTNKSLKKYIKKLTTVKAKFLLNTIVLSLSINLVLLLGFKKLRALVPPPQISDGKLVGFAQYFGYPLYFDTAFFFALILVPFVTFVIFYKKNKK